MTNQNLVRSLKDIIQFELSSIFRRHHLNRDVVIGLIGARGDGKSLGGTAIAILDYMVESDPCWSNIAISVEFDISAETAARYGQLPGKAKFTSQPLDKTKLLRFDPEYQGGVFFVDEINLWLADARRSMSNQNLWANDVGQQLRKMKSALIYTCIHEMFVDQRIRDMTDIFIQTKDMALSPEGLAKRDLPGREFMWTIFPMSRKLTGESYAQTRKPLPNIFFHGNKWWNTFDTYQRQEREYLKKLPAVTADLTMTEDPVVVKAKHDFGWIHDIGKAMWEDGREIIPCEEVMALSQVIASGLPQKRVSQLLREHCEIGTGYERVDRPWREGVYKLLSESSMEVNSKKRLLLPA